jgi:hypothetical protein
MSVGNDAGDPLFDKVIEALGTGAEWSVEFDRDADDNYFILNPAVADGLQQGSVG